MGSLVFLILTMSAQAATLEDLVTSARINGLGGAYAALAEGESSLFINPAGLAYLPAESVAAGAGHYYGPAIANYHFGYYRPLFEGITAATAWQGTHSLLQDMDRFYLSWAQSEKTGRWFVRDSRLSWGLSLRTLSVRTRPDPSQSFKNKLGVGLDGGVLLRLPKNNTSVALSLIGMDTANLDLLGPHLTFGLRHDIGSLKFLFDLRVREKLSLAYPAIEYGFYHELVHLRLGRGMRFGELHTVALGMGFNLLPLVADVAFHAPIEGLHRDEGAAIFSMNYAFGGPQLAERLTGRAAGEMQRLSVEIDDLTQRKRHLADNITAAESDLGVLQQEIKALELRKRDEYIKVQLKEVEKEGEMKKQQGQDSPATPSASQGSVTSGQEQSQWPRRHRVVEGDTLRRLAIEYYGDPALWELIYKANLEKVERGLPKTGVILIIPNPSALTR